MHSRAFRTRGLWTTALIALLSGCGEEDEARTVPGELSGIESEAEDAFDLALAGNTSAVADGAGRLSDAWGAYRPTAEADGVAADAIAELDAAIEALVAATDGAPSAVELARVTNAVSAPMAAFYEVYDPTIPAPVLTLDYEGREIRLDAMEGDFARAGTDVDTLSAAWQSLRTRVVNAGGTTEADDFDASVQDERDAIGAADATTLDDVAVVQLELVDAVEQVFASTVDPAD